MEGFLRWKLLIWDEKGPGDQIRVHFFSINLGNFKEIIIFRSTAREFLVGVLIKILHFSQMIMILKKIKR
ncbi:MAG: hypothetical protein CM15mP111_0230 [Hyphomicrobiales bacterium]|nr:MAG: hypothetical protein CM15mP111_0230 [Hyphomicrobiales bacterium]